MWLASSNATAAAPPPLPSNPLPATATPINTGQALPVFGIAQ